MGLDGALGDWATGTSASSTGSTRTLWNPATDAALAATYSAADPRRQGGLPAGPADAGGLRPGDDGPVLGMIGRLDPQKGFDLLADGGPRPARGRRPDRRPGQRRPHARGPRSGRSPPREPRRVALVERFDRDMARRIYAGADVFLMPSRFEPCGQGQMIALRYGTPPVVRRTGGLGRHRRSTWTSTRARAPASSSTRRRRRRSSPPSTRAASLRRREPASWAALLDRGMAVDFNWVTGSAPRYLDAYRQAIALRLA